MSIVDALAFRAYLRGYGRRPFPRLLRRVLARTQIHRAWLAGSLGYFVDADTGQIHGPTCPSFPCLSPEAPLAGTQDATR